MSASLSSAYGKTTLHLSYSASNDVMQMVLESVCRSLYDEGLAWWSEANPPPPYE